MNVNLPANFGSAVATFSPLGREAVGEESVESKSTSFKSVEEPAKTAASQPHLGSDRANDLSTTVSEQDQHANQQKDALERQQQQDQQLIQRLASRDREVRAHERAHASVGGQFAGTPSYEFQRGPDGVSYAVGGEVSISTGGVPNDPEATIAKAQQIQRAALAPADPSSQDRAVAAGAASLELQALAELAQQRRDEVLSSKAEETEQRAAQQAESDQVEKDQGEADAQSAVAAEEASQQRSEVSDTQINLLRRLQDIGAVPIDNAPGELLDLSA